MDQTRFVGTVVSASPTSPASFFQYGIDQIYKVHFQGKIRNCVDSYFLEQFSVFLKIKYKK